MPGALWTHRAALLERGAPCTIRAAPSTPAGAPLHQLHAGLTWHSEALAGEGLQVAENTGGTQSQVPLSKPCSRVCLG